MSTLVNPAFVRTMAAYNAEMNRRLYDRGRAHPRSGAAAAARRVLGFAARHALSSALGRPDVDVAVRRLDEANGDPEAERDPGRSISMSFGDCGSTPMTKISAWAGRVTEAWLAEDQAWFSSSVQKELRSPRSFLVTHFFNHQTHHRGQAHALITACGEKTGDTDLFLLVEPG